MANSGSKSGKKGIGRSNRKPACLRYKSSERWVRNKVRNIVKHMRKFPNYKPHNLSPDIRDKVKKSMQEV